VSRIGGDGGTRTCLRPLSAVALHRHLSDRPGDRPLPRRYIDEIAAWYDASAAEKRAILTRIAERRRSGRDGTSEKPE